MKVFRLNLIFIFLLFSFPIIYPFPCPSECICKPTEIIDVGFTRMNYIINCANVILNDNKLIYHAPSWSILEDKTGDDGFDDETSIDYIISIDLSNSSSLPKFTNKTIQLTGFSYSLYSFSLTSQSKYFILESNAFNSDLYQNLNALNLSSCCQQIPNECQEVFRPLKKLRILDLSGSDLYKTCLNTPDTISSNLQDLILRNNDYNTNTFSHTSRFFDGVREITGKLDLQYSRFNLSSQLTGNCLFDLFTEIKSLDLSYTQFQSISNDTEVHLAHLLKCTTQANNTRHGEQILSLYLRQLNLQYLPEWFTNTRFPLLRQLDLANNNIHSIDFSNFLTLRQISLAYNPIELHNITWRKDTMYQSINLRSTIQNETFNLQTRVKHLFNITSNIDYSENYGKIFFNLTKFSISNDFLSIDSSLKLSRTNLNSFEINQISTLDDLKRLDISSNNLTDLNLAKQSKLKYLQCSNQNLKNLILNKENVNLIELICSNNSLTNFTISNYNLLEVIDLSFNLIENLENFFFVSNNRYLRIINFKSNLITKISSNIFLKNFLSLYSIDLSWNRINTIEKYAFQSPNLQILDLTGNPLKVIQPKFLLISSLRLFFIINTTQQLIDRCAQSTSDDVLLLDYITWFEQNGTYMKMTQIERSKQIQLDKCLRRYQSRSKVKWMKIKNQHHFKHLSLYIFMAAICVGIILGSIYLYKKNKLDFWKRFQRYRPIDRDSLVENPEEISRYKAEDDEIVMNLDQPPFNTIHSV